MAKANEVYSSGQFLTASLSHFELTKTGLAAGDMKHIVETISTRATVVILGAINGTKVKVAVENNGAWTAATLDAALEPTDVSTDWAVAVHAY